VELTRVGEFTLVWGESLRWDDARGRLYFVDCATQMLHWLDGTEPPLQSMKMPSMPAGIVLADDGRIVAALDDGLHVVDTDAETTDLLAPYPDGLGGRANDAAADLDGNIVTGTLNIAPGPGSYWWYSAADGWRELDDGIGNANGPVVLQHGDRQTLVFADTQAAEVYAYDYDGRAGRVGTRCVFADTSELAGVPDGACGDASNGVWSCVLGRGVIVRYDDGGAVTQLVETGVELPSDVTFAGASLDDMFFVSIAVDIAGIQVSAPNAGALMRVDGVGYRGRPEPRVRL
jgi:L-arabinonolactonase